MNDKPKRTGGVAKLKLACSKLTIEALQEENRRLRDEIAEYKALLMEDEDAE